MREQLESRVNGLADAIEEEIRKRVRSENLLRRETERFCNCMLDRFSKNVVERIAVAAGSIESLCTRARTISNYFKQYKGELPSRLRLELDEIILAVTQLRQELEVGETFDE